LPQLLFSGVIVDFTKLHKDFTSYKYVPVIGDLMTSRWAYEALSVAQFKNNEFEKHFFDTDMAKSQLSYKLSYQITNLEERAKKISEETDSLQQIRHIRVLRTETQKLINESGLNYADFDKLRLADFDAAMLKSYQAYLYDLKKKYNAELYEVRKKADTQFNELMTELGGKEAVFELQRKYNNKQLADIMKNKNEMDGMEEKNGELIQIVDPIYKLPATNNGRAHFYAPVKKIGNMQVDTVVYDVIFIWFTIFITYLFLHFNVFRKAIELSGKLKRKR